MTSQILHGMYRLPWWEDEDRITYLIKLADDIIQEGEGHHIIGIGQSPYYPLFTANLLSITQQGKPLPHSIVPMSGHCTDVEGPVDGVVHFSLNEYAATHKEAIERFADQLGHICEEADRQGLKPMFIDMLQMGGGITSAAYALSVYDSKTGTNFLGNAKIAVFNQYGYARDFPLKEETIYNIPTPRGSHTFNVVRLYSESYLTHVLSGANAENGQRVVPEQPIENWGLPATLTPDAPVPQKIMQTIRAAVEHSPKVVP